MKIAILMQCHNSVNQINRFLEVLAHPDVTVYIHVDKKADIINQIKRSDNIYFVKNEDRVDVRWGTYSQVAATLALLKCATKNENYDFFILISGQDFLTWPIEKLLSFLQDNKNANFVDLFASKHNGLGYSCNYDKRNEIVYPAWLLKRNLFIRLLRRGWVQITGGYHHTFSIFKRKQINSIKHYFGSSWWGINGETMKWMLSYLESNPSYEKFFQCSCCPDECFFQTLLMNSPFENTRQEYLHYIDWSEGESSPKILTMDDYQKIVDSGKPFIRKVAGDVQLLDKLTDKLKEVNGDV